MSEIGRKKGGGVFGKALNDDRKRLWPLLKVPVSNFYLYLLYTKDFLIL